MILTFDGPVLVDLGIAASAELTSITATGMTVGTLTWMAPEQFRTGAVGTSADVWGWGCIAYYASTGRLPFGSGPAAIQRIESEDPNVADLPAWLRGTVRHALAKDPRSRPTAATLAANSAAPTQVLRAGDGVTAEATRRLALDDTARVSRIRRTRWPWIAAGAALVLIIAGLAGVLASRNSGTSSRGLTPPTSSARTAPASAQRATPAATATAASTAPSSPSGADSADTRVGQESAGYSFELPGTWHQTSPPDSIQGMAWADPSSQALVYVTVQPNTADDTPQSELNSCIQVAAMSGGRPTYTYADTQTYICTGYTRTGDVHYERGVVGKNQIYTMVWNYPAALKPTMDPVLQHSVDTFTPGPL